MSELSRPELARTGQTVVRPAATPLTAPALMKSSSLRELCDGWLDVDLRLEELTLEWSQAETLSFTAGVESARTKAAAMMQQLEHKIARIDRRRSGLVDRIATKPADNLADAFVKLLVVERLLEGEGGTEHDIVADVVRTLADGLGMHGRPRGEERHV